MKLFWCVCVLLILAESVCADRVKTSGYTGKRAKRDDGHKRDVKQDSSDNAGPVSRDEIKQEVVALSEAPAE